MTRTQKFNNRDHAGLADGTADAFEHLPRYFAKSGHVGEAPNKVKKEGGGKANWGHPGEEAHDMGYSFTAARRRSNSSVHNVLSDFTTKFETPEEDPFFEEHMAAPKDDEYPSEHHELKKHDSNDSVDTASTADTASATGSFDEKE